MIGNFHATPLDGDDNLETISRGFYNDKLRLRFLRLSTTMFTPQILSQIRKVNLGGGWCMKIPGQCCMYFDSEGLDCNY